MDQKILIWLARLKNCFVESFQRVHQIKCFDFSATQSKADLKFISIFVLKSIATIQIHCQLMDEWMEFNYFTFFHLRFRVSLKILLGDKIGSGLIAAWMKDEEALQCFYFN